MLWVVTQILFVFIDKHFICILNFMYVASHSFNSSQFCFCLSIVNSVTVKPGMLIITEVDHEIVTFIRTLNVSAAFTWTRCSSVSLLSTTAFTVGRLLLVICDQSDRAVGGTLSETTEGVTANVFKGFYLVKYEDNIEK